MKSDCSARTPIILILALAIILSHGNSFADTIDEAIEYYQNADFEKAKNIFEKTAAEEQGEIKDRQTALAYLALLETVSHNPKEADNHLFKLLLMDPSFEIKTIEDMRADVEDHFNKIKSKDIFKAILFYQDAEFEKAKKNLEGLAKAENKTDDCQIALVYLALMEIALWNPEGADTYLSKLASLNPSFELKNIGDVNQELKKRFEQIKSGEKPEKAETKPVQPEKDKDTTTPSGEIAGIRESYNIGDDVSYKISGKDDQRLKKIVFKVKENSAATKNWDANEKSVTYKSSFSTEGWKADTYNYSLLITDDADNPKEYSGTFVLKEKEPDRDTVKPTGEILGIKTTYKQGDTVNYTVRAGDNKSLKKMTFEVKDNASVKKIWNAGGTSASYQSSFSTNGWGPGTYCYSFLIEDDSENSEKVTGEFAVALPPEKIKELQNLIKEDTESSEEHKEKPDTDKPAGEIVGIGDTYTQGDVVSYTVRAKDNKSLKKMTFEVKDNASAKKIWNAGGTSASYQSSFSTDGWGPGTYCYSLLIEDDSENSEKVTGEFAVTLPPGKIKEIKNLIKEDTERSEEPKERPDSDKPTGEIVGIGDTYTQGDTVSYTVRAKDNKSLKVMTFKVKEKSSESKTWKAAGTSERQSSSFSTARWSPGTYHYVFSIDDTAGNAEEYSGSFVLKAKPEESDSSKPSGEIIGIKRTYTQGDSVSYTARAKDNKSLKKITFKVNNKDSAGKIWNAGGTSANYKSSFSTEGWEPGTYSYSLLLKDSADNSQEYTGNFILKEKEPDKDKIKPTGEIRGIRNSYTEGEKVNYTVEATDNKPLKMMTFSVKENTSAKKMWVIAGKSAKYKSSFSTEGWKPGIYSYVFLIEDEAGNSQEYTGSFTLIKQKGDEIPPTGEISGINKNCTEGDIIHYTVSAKDNKNLKHMTFEADRIKEDWDISGQSASRMSFFSTQGWKTGTYNYSLRVEDSEGNSNQYKGNFVLVEQKRSKSEPPETETDKSGEKQPKPDKIRPSATFGKTKGTYEQGEKVTFVIHAKDNESLRSISFSLKNSSIRESWDVSGSSATREYSFSTGGWEPGAYSYSITIKDKAGNFQDYAGRFLITKNESSFDKLRRLNQELSQAYGEYTKIKMLEGQGVNADRQLIPVIRKIIGILKSLEAAYKEFPPTLEIREGIRDTQTAIKRKQEELNSKVK